MSSLRLVLIFSSLCLGVEIILWEIWLAPLHQGAFALALLSLPVFWMTYSAWHKHNYGLQVASMLILAYLAEGVMRVLNDRGVSALLAAIEIALAAIFFVSDLVLLAPFKRRARKAVKS